MAQSYNKIDPLYKKYSSKVISALASTEFYEYFMSVMASAQNTFQFSNRRIEKTVDERWVKAVEAVMKPMQEIIDNPRNFIVSEEIISNIALVKKVEPDGIRHLAQHGNMIDEVTDTSVRPNKMMEKTKEDSWNTYENRFVYTLLEMTWDFVDKRYEALFSSMNEEYGAHLIMSSDARSYQEHITANVELRIQQDQDLLSTDKKNETIFSRIARLHRLLGIYRTSAFAKTVAKFGKIKPPLVRTNAIAKNPNFKACHKLWDFILTYRDVGYQINIFDQSRDIDANFQKDITHSIMFNYIILKNYLEANEDRAIDTSRKFKKKALKPKYIREIVEEIVKNYDLPDVEIRKVLIEEITKAQLMQEEEKERQRLVAEKEQEIREREKEEKKEAAKKARAEERERLRRQKEEEKAAARRERERLAAEARQKREQERLEGEEQAQLERYRAELKQMTLNRKAVLDERAKRNAAAAEELAEQTAEAEQRRIREETTRSAAAEKEKAKAAAEKKKAKAAAEKKKAKAAAEKEKAKAAAEKEKAKAAAEKAKAKAKSDAAKEEKKIPVAAATKEEIRPAAEEMPAQTAAEIAEEPLEVIMKAFAEKPAEVLVAEKPAEAVAELPLEAIMKEFADKPAEVPTEDPLEAILKEFAEKPEEVLTEVIVEDPAEDPLEAILKEFAEKPEKNPEKVLELRPEQEPASAEPVWKVESIIPLWERAYPAISEDETELMREEEPESVDEAELESDEEQRSGAVLRSLFGRVFRRGK